jgi:phage protein D/phage baseplate assembly protein gpV
VPDLSIVPKVTINGTPLGAPAMQALVDMRIIGSLLETSWSSLRFSDPNMTMLDTAGYDIGDPVKISVVAGSTTTTVFSGEVTAIGADQRSQLRHEFVLEAMDKSHRLSAVCKPKTYLMQKWSDIVSAIAGAHGLSAKCTVTTVINEYVLQTTNDRAFLTEIAESIGWEWFVDDADLVFRPRPSSSTTAAALKWSTNLRFEARSAGSDTVQTVNVHGWNAKNKEAILGTSSAKTAVAEAIGSTSPLATGTYNKGATMFGKTVDLVPGVMQDATEADLRAEAIGRDVQAASTRASGETMFDAAIKPGVWVAVSECGAKLSGSYYVTECEHVFGEGQPFRTRFKMTGHRASGLSGMAAASRPSSFGQTGLVIGIVTNIYDSQENSQRVKVTFPTMPDLESAWARVLTFGGGPTAGMDMRPEVDDEVVVGFEHGDPRRPFIIGGLINARDTNAKASLNSDGSLNMRAIRSRGGNKIELFDGATKDASSGRYIKFTSADTGTVVTIGDDKVTITTKDGNPIELKSGEAKLTLKDGDVTIAGTSIAFKATSGVKMEGATVDVKGSSKVAIDGGAQFAAKGAMVQLEASGVAALKGSIVKIN